MTPYEFGLRINASEKEAFDFTGYLNKGLDAAKRVAARGAKTVRQEAVDGLSKARPTPAVSPANALSVKAPAARIPAAPTANPSMFQRGLNAAGHGAAVAADEGLTSLDNLGRVTRHYAGKARDAIRSRLNPPEAYKPRLTYNNPAERGLIPYKAPDSRALAQGPRNFQFYEPPQRTWGNIGTGAGVGLGAAAGLTAINPFRGESEPTASNINNQQLSTQLMQGQHAEAGHGAGLMGMWNSLPIEARYAIGAGVPLALAGAFMGGRGSPGLGGAMGALGLGAAGLGAAGAGMFGDGARRLVGQGANGLYGMMGGGGNQMDQINALSKLSPEFGTTMLMGRDPNMNSEQGRQMYDFLTHNRNIIEQLMPQLQASSTNGLKQGSAREFGKKVAADVMPQRAYSSTSIGNTVGGPPPGTYTGKVRVPIHNATSSATGLPTRVHGSAGVSRGEAEAANRAAGNPGVNQGAFGPSYILAPPKNQGTVSQNMFGGLFSGGGSPQTLTDPARQRASAEGQVKSVAYAQQPSLRNAGRPTAEQTLMSTPRAGLPGMIKEQSVSAFLLKLEKSARCWKGYEPVPGKKPYSNDSCRPAGSKKKKKNEKKAVSSAARGKTDMTLEPSSRGTKKLIDDKQRETNSPVPTDAKNNQQSHEKVAVPLGALARGVGRVAAGTGRVAQKAVSTAGRGAQMAGGAVASGGNTLAQGGMNMARSGLQQGGRMGAAKMVAGGAGAAVGHGLQGAGTIARAAGTGARYVANKSPAGATMLAGAGLYGLGNTSAAEPYVNSAQEFGRDMYDRAANGISDAGAAASSAGNLVGSAFNSAGSALGDAAGTAYGTARNAVVNTANSARRGANSAAQAVAAVPQAIGQGIHDTGAALGDAAGTAYGNARNSVVNTANDVRRGVNNTVQMAQTYVPNVRNPFYYDNPPGVLPSGPQM